MRLEKIDVILNTMENLSGLTNVKIEVSQCNSLTAMRRTYERGTKARLSHTLL